MRAIDEGLTPGLSRALSKNKTHKLCDCGFPMPVYPGRYPSKCPVCSTPREGSGDADSPAA